MMVDQEQHLKLIRAGLLPLVCRLIEARRSALEVPSELTTDEIITGLLDIHRFEPWQVRQAEARGEKIRRRAVSVVRTLIGAMVEGGLPGKDAYGFFNQSDLNLLFYIHSGLPDTDQHADIPFHPFTHRGE